jgi:hypothetical protein
MTSGRYEPHRDASGYPGTGISEERSERLRNLDILAHEITADDIVHSLSRNGSGTFFLLMRLVAESAGQEAADEVARRFGYLVGRANYRKMQKRFGVTTLGPERLAMYEDAAHLLGGVDMAYCFTEYDEHTCAITRTRCAFHTGHPPGTGHLCPLLNEGFAKAYTECDPGLVEVGYRTSLAWGDDHCEHFFRYESAGDRA